MRLTEFWARMEKQLGVPYARSFAKDMVLSTLGSRTVLEALEQGEPAKDVWRGVCAYLEVPSH